MGIFREGDFPGGSLLGGNFPGGDFPVGNFPRTLIEILDKMCIAIVCFQDCDGIKFEINISFKSS